MLLGIPTLRRYELLDRLLQSAEAGTLRPSRYVIIDNGGSYSPDRLKAALGPRADRAQLIWPGSNIGVAASWNRILELAGDEGAVISNDDVCFGAKTFEEMVRGAAEHPFVEGDGWALFAQTGACTRDVGFYDENYWPAYYEDVDYDLRLTRAGLTPFRALSAPVEHVGWATSRGIEHERWLADGRERNHAYFLRKWGAESANPRWNGHAGITHYAEPFDGKPPAGWSDRRRSKPIPMRWDVVNAIAERIGAERYLEIGVADGDSISRVAVREKWGVDPAPSLGGVRAADVTYRGTSASFFDRIAPNAGKFDLVFVDGDHVHDVVLYELREIRKILSPEGVIVLHDCNPHTEDMQRVPWVPGEWTGDVWKAIVREREAHSPVEVVAADYGIGICYAPHQRPGPTGVGVPREGLTWEYFCEHRSSWLVDPFVWEARFSEMRARSGLKG